MIRQRLKKFVPKQFENFARNKGMEMADNAIKSVSRKVQDRFFAKDFQPEIDATSDNGIFDLAVDSTTINKVWLLIKHMVWQSTLRILPMVIFRRQFLLNRWLKKFSLRFKSGYSRYSLCIGRR